MSKLLTTSVVILWIMLFYHPAFAQNLVVGENQTVDNIRVRDGVVEIAGRATGSIEAINSEVVIKSTAQIEGPLSLKGGVVDINKGARFGLADSTRPFTLPAALPRFTFGSWLNGQFSLLMLGVLGAIVISLSIPNMTSHLARQTPQNLARYLGTGLLAGLGILILLVTTNKLSEIRSVFSILTTPLMVITHLGSLALLVSGWMVGMKAVSDQITERLSFRFVDSLLKSMLFGLASFFVLNSLLGGIHPILGTIGLLIEFAVAVMGIGAIISTGFGQENDWLERRLRGQARWWSNV